VTVSVDDMTYVLLVSVNEPEVQNVQELVSVWGDVRRDIERLGGTLRTTYGLLGRYDYLVIFEAPDGGTALQISVAMERYGLDVETLEGIPLEQFGELVEEI
jgi:uncharacterized protein with GYD domain